MYITGCTLTTEKIGVGGSVPEDLGILAANILLEEILRVFSLLNSVFRGHHVIFI